MYIQTIAKASFLCLAFLCFNSFIFDDWSLEKDTNGVKVFTRTVSGSDLKEYRAETLINAPVSELIGILKQPIGLSKWMEGCSEAKLLKQISSTETILYYYNPAPWPVKDRDSISKMTFQDEADGSVKVLIEGLPDYLPEVDGVVRVPHLKGYWKFTPVGNKTKVVQQVHASPGGNIPSWLANSSVVDIPFKTFLNLKKLAE